MAIIKAYRIITNGKIPFQDVEILDLDEQKERSIPNFFEEFQVVFRSQGRMYIIPQYQITYIWWRKGKIKPPKRAVKVRRLTIDGEIVHSPAHIIDQNLYKEIGLPNFFDPVQQFAFIGANGLYITSDFKIQLIEYK